MTELLRMDWLTDNDVFTMRQRGRDVATAVGLDGQDQIRVATALSEVGRELLRLSPSSVVFSVLTEPSRLSIDVRTTIPIGQKDADEPQGIVAARRLIDDVVVHTDDGGTVVTLEKLLPATAGRMTKSTLTKVRAALAAVHATTPLEELRAQNAELVRTLDQLTQRQQELQALNDELEDTNRGVVAMYSQLSGELEETNRGVVALYAELDEKGAQLSEANDAKTRFLRNVSHELRAPVSSILGLADLLADSTLDPEQQRQVDYLHGSARSLLGLVNELLDLARAESGALVVTPAEVDLADLFGQLRGTLRPLATERGLKLIIDAPDIPLLVTDADLLTRVLRNLLSNALSFTENGQVVMQAGLVASGQHVEITVRDTGIGIPADQQDRIFEEFVQVPGPLQTGRSGTGLGLPYARRVSNALHGSLTLSSTPGEGSAFTVLLPVTPPVEQEEPGSVSVGHVLVVDDDVAFRHVVRGMLQGVADRVSEAGDGVEALDFVRDLVPDLILLDLRMPNMDGPAVLQALRSSADERLRHVPVVLMTSVDIDAEVRRAAEPAEALLAKTDISRGGLLRLVDSLLNGGADREEDR